MLWPPLRVLELGREARNSPSSVSLLIMSLITGFSVSLTTMQISPNYRMRCDEGGRSCGGGEIFALCLYIA